jgi:serine/threonine protein kinase
MERLVGETVRAALLREGRWPTGRALRVLGAVASAVDAAHEQHLVHRDLKPENVFLVRVKDQEVPKVLDFGIAKSFGAAGDTAALGGTAPGVLVGTPKYMSPEQLQGGEASPAWDLWAFGVLAYEVLTGAPPFPSPITGSGQEAIRAGRAASTRATFGESAAVWDALFAQLFASDPARRPNSAQALVAALTAAAERMA